MTFASNCIYIFIVSKTTRELLLLWHESSPVDLSSDLKMPQFTVEEVVTDKCEESSMIGKYKSIILKNFGPVIYTGCLITDRYKVNPFFEGK